MVPLYTETARFKWVGHKNELCFLRDTLLVGLLSSFFGGGSGVYIYGCSFWVSDSFFLVERKKENSDNYGHDFSDDF